MERVIGGRSYNTSTATRMFSDKSCLPSNDFAYWEEELYQTKKGAWFIRVEGGPLSHWGDGAQHGYIMRIVPLTELEAFKYLADKNDAEAVDVLKGKFSMLIEEA